MQHAAASVLGIAMALLSGACRDGGNMPDAPVTPADAPADAPPDAAPDRVRQTVAEVLATPNRDLDLLFVIDDSPSMLDKQRNLANNFPAFSIALQALPGGLPNLHLGVITTDMGTKASGSPTPAAPIGQIGQGGCSGTGKGGALQIFSAPVTGRFLVDVEQAGGGRVRNYTGTLEQAFGQMANAGAGGCGFEQPLAAMRAALDNHPANTGFLRAGAMLGIFFLADEDDCSTKDPALFGPDQVTLGALQSFRCTRFGVTCAAGGQTTDAMNQAGAKGGCGPNASSMYIDDLAPYRDFLAGLKPNPTRVFAGGIMGPTEPFAVELRPPPGGGAPLPAVAHACAYQGSIGLEVADPAVRLARFLDVAPSRAPSTTICMLDYSGSMMMLAERVQQTMRGGCVESQLADLDAGTPGPQIDCLVEDVVGAAATPIPSCDTSPAARPCWQLQSDATACRFSPAPNLQLVVQRATNPDPATVTRMRCLVDR